MERQRVVIAGLGDAGVLTAIRLARHADVVGISAKPALVSGQELGVRLSRPGDWARDYWIPFDKFRRLDRVRTVHAALTGLDPAARTVFGRFADGTQVAEEYDALVISTWSRQRLLASADAAGSRRHRRRAARRARAACRRRVDHRRGRRRGRGQQRRQHGNHVAGQAH